MNDEELLTRLRAAVHHPMPLPAAGHTPARYRMLMKVAREDLSLARLVEAHFDAVAILAEAGREAVPNAVYGVWASEKVDAPLTLDAERNTVSGTKMFCGGAGLVDRALITVGGATPTLIEVDVRAQPKTIRIDTAVWKTPTFAQTRTATVHFSDLPFATQDVIGQPGWYLARPGFWHGACGPSACWVGGAAGLLDFARLQTRQDPHTLAHLGAMEATVWGLEALLDAAGRESDAHPNDVANARIVSLKLRHLVEQSCTDVIRRFARAYGPFPLAMLDGVSKQYYELDLYLRQSHAERDLEFLARVIRGL